MYSANGKRNIIGILFLPFSGDIFTLVKHGKNARNGKNWAVKNRSILFAKKKRRARMRQFVHEQRTRTTQQPCGRHPNPNG